MWAWIKKQLPTAQKIQKNPSLHWIAKWIRKRPYLWEYTRHSVASAVAVSMFIAFLPLPLEMLIATILSIFAHANLSITIISTWITSPITLIPANYFSYKVGAWILQSNNHAPTFKKIELHWHNLGMLWNELGTWIASMGKAYLVGLPIVSISSALIAYGMVYLVWTGIEWTHRVIKKSK